MKQTTSERPRKHIKFQIFLIILILLVTGTAVFFFWGMMSHRPENVVSQYMATYFAREFGEMYDLIDVPDGVFMTEEMFCAAMDKQIEDAGTAKMNNIKRVASSDAGTLKFSAGYGTYSGGVEDTKVVVLKPDGKDFGMFTKYKVVPDRYVLADELRLTVPKGAKVYLSGKEVTSKNAELSQKENFDTSAISDSYLIKPVFMGSYILKVTTEFAEDFEKGIPVEYSASATVKLSDLKAKSADTEKLTANNKTLLETAAAGKPIDSIERYFTKNSGYAALYEKIKGQVSGIQVSDIKSDFGERKISEAGELSAKISFKANGKQISGTVYYLYDGGWKINKISDLK